MARTYRFYSDALAARFDVVAMKHAPNSWRGIGVDAVVNFSGANGWQFDEHPNCPLIFALHGGAVLNRTFLRAHLPRLETTDALLANCTSDLAVIRDVCGHRPPQLHLVPLPVRSDVFVPLGRREGRSGLPLEDRDFVVGFVARLLPQKNLHGFLRLFAQLKRWLSPRTLGGIVIGDYWLDYPVLDFGCSSYPQTIDRLARQLGVDADLIHLPADLTDVQLALSYSAMDLLIHPTYALDENFGYTPLEAMACATPVVGAAYGGLKDTVVSNENGYLMPTWATDGGIRIDVLFGAHRSLRLLQSPERRNHMAAAARLRATQDYAPGRCAEQLQSAVIDTITAGESARRWQVDVAPSVDPEIAAGVLPHTDPPWAEFYPAVSRYVSGSPPGLTWSSWVRQAAPVTPCREGTFRLDDPAWPAEYRIDDPSRTLVDRCADETRARALGDSSDVLDRLSSLLRRGVIIASDGT